MDICWTYEDSFRGVQPTILLDQLRRHSQFFEKCLGAAATVRCRCDRSRLRESAACSRDSVRLSARTRAREGIGSDPILHPMHGTASARTPQIMRRYLCTLQFLSVLFQTCQTTRSVTPSPQCLPARQTHRNNLPAQIPAAATQRSMVFLTHSGTGTVRMWPPLPTRSTMAQCSSRCRNA